MEAFKKGLAKLLFKQMDTQELQDSEKVVTIWVKNLSEAVNKMNNTVLSMIGMKPKDVIELDTVPLDKHIQKKSYYPRMDYIDTFISLMNNMETKKDKQQILFGVKIRID